MIKRDPITGMFEEYPNPDEKVIESKNVVDKPITPVVKCHKGRSKSVVSRGG